MITRCKVDEDVLVNKARTKRGDHEMTAPSMRELITIMEATMPRKSQPSYWRVVRYDGPNSSRVVDEIQIPAANRGELNARVREWMDQIGLDPDD